MKPPAFSFDRRRFLWGAGAAVSALAIRSLPAVAATPSPAQGVDRDRLGFDPSDPRAAQRAYLRIAFASPGEAIVWWYRGELYGYVQDFGFRPMMRSATILIARVDSPRNDYARVTCEEVGYSRDFETGRRLDAFQHPFTGERMPLPPFHDEPYVRDHYAALDTLLCQKTAHGSVEPEPLLLEWEQRGGEVAIRQSSPVVKPSSSGWLPYSRYLDFYADAAAARRPASFVPCEQNYLVTFGLPGFVGRKAGDGLVVLRGFARKGRLGEVLDPEVLAAIGESQPEFARRVATPEVRK